MTCNFHKSYFWKWHEPILAVSWCHSKNANKNNTCLFPVQNGSSMQRLFGRQQRKMHQLALSIQTFSHILSLESSYFWHLWVGSDFFIIQECSKIYLCWAEVQNQFKLFLKCWKHQRHSSSERSYVNTCKKNQSYSIRSRCNSPFQG